MICMTYGISHTMIWVSKGATEPENLKNGKDLSDEEEIHTALSPAIGWYQNYIKHTRYKESSF